MTDDNQRGLRPATAAEIEDTLSYALHYAGRKRVHTADEVMARVTAKRLVQHLEQSGYVYAKIRGQRRPRACVATRTATEPAGYVELQVITNHSVLREVSSVGALLVVARALGLPVDAFAPETSGLLPPLIWAATPLPCRPEPPRPGAQTASIERHLEEASPSLRHDIGAGGFSVGPIIDQARHVQQWHRPSQQKALGLIATRCTNKFQLLLGFDPFGGHLDA